MDRIIIGLAVVVFIAGIIFLNLPESVRRTKTTEKLGVMSSVKNQVRLRPAGSYSWFDLNSWFKEDIYNLDGIFTGENSTAQIELDSGDIVYLDANSMIVLEKARDGEIQLNVVSGAVKTEGPTVQPRQIIRQHQRLLIKNKKFKIEQTPTPVPKEEEPIPQITETNPEPSPEPPPPDPEPAVATEAAPPVEEPLPVVEKPAVPKKRLIPISGAELVLKRPSAKERWSGAKPLIQAQWPEMSEAKFYTIEIFQKKDQRSELLQKFKTHKPRFEIPFEKTGEFQFLISGLISSDDRQPASISKAQAMKSLAIDPLQEFPRPAGLFPQNRQLVLAPQNQSLYFKWQRSKRFTLYALQFSKDSDFKTIEKEFLLSNFEFKENPQLSPGVWHWRVKGLSETGESPWGPVQEFRLVYE